MPKNFKMCDHVSNLLEPIGLSINLTMLNDAVEAVNKLAAFDPKICITWPNRQAAISLTHPKIIPQASVEQYGELRSKFIGAVSAGENSLRTTYGLSTANFTEMHPTVQNSYIKTVADQIDQYHLAKYGVGKIRWIHAASLGPGAGFCMHIDEHCLARYHVALQTTDYCYVMVEEENQIKTVHIPADGRVWFLDSNALHNAVNYTPAAESNLVRTHLIFSVYGT